MNEKFKNGTISIEFNGLEDFHKRLISFEPAVIEAQFNAVVSVAEQARQKIISSIPTGWKLRESIVARVRTYGPYVFFTVGLGGPGSVTPNTAPKNMPIRYGRWQEHGWEPVRWDQEKMTRKKRSRKKKPRSPSWNESTGIKKRKGFEAGGTPPLHYVEGNKAAIREMVVKAMQEAFDKAVSDLGGNNATIPTSQGDIDTLLREWEKSKLQNKDKIIS